MGFTLNNIVPWGRSFDEYVAMFSLSPTDLERRLLGCGDGPAAFNAFLARQGGRVISVDPLYRFSTNEIRHRIRETYADVMEQMRKNRHDFIWKNIKTLDALGKIRMDAMEEFLADYPQGKAQGRYIDGQLPHLPFNDQDFDLAVCSHLLFLYSEQYSEDFHIASIRELSRVAREVRVFPLLELGSGLSRHFKAVTEGLSDMGYEVAIERVYYEFQRGGNKMMKIKRGESFSPPDPTDPAALGIR